MPDLPILWNNLQNLKWYKFTVAPYQFYDVWYVFVECDHCSACHDSTPAVMKRLLGITAVTWIALICLRQADLKSQVARNKARNWWPNDSKQNVLDDISTLQELYKKTMWVVTYLYEEGSWFIYVTHIVLWSNELKVATDTLFRWVWGMGARNVDTILLGKLLRNDFLVHFLFRFS